MLFKFLRFFQQALLNKKSSNLYMLLIFILKLLRSNYRTLLSTTTADLIGSFYVMIKCIFNTNDNKKLFGILKEEQLPSLDE